MNDDITKKDVIACISKERKSSFLNHFLTFFIGRKYLSGEINERNILIWSTNQWLSAWFPVFNLEFNRQNELINISYSKNWFAKFLDFVFYVLISIAFIYILRSIDYSLSSLTLPLFFLIMVGIVNYLFYSIYRFEAKNQLEELYDIIGIENDLKSKS